MRPHVVLATATDDPAITASDRLYADALERRGCRVTGAPWDGPLDAFAGAGAVILRSTWGYYRTLDAFRAWTETVAAETRLFNPIELVRWNLRKDYVAKLAAAGVRVPRSFVLPCDAAAVVRVFDETGWTHAVVKPASGASGHSVELLQRATLAAQVAGLSEEARAAGVVVQEFLPEIVQGELSLVYFDGIFSHALRKRPPPGEFRSNSRFKPTRTAETPPPSVTDQGASCLATLPAMPLYARVDGVVRDGALIVIEVEALEPALFMEFDPPAAERFADATMKRLAR